MSLSREERAAYGRVGALESWSRTEDRAARTAPARRAAAERFHRQVDPDGVLDPAERERRAEAAKRAYFQRMAIKSAQARRRTSTQDESVGRTSVKEIARRTRALVEERGWQPGTDLEDRAALTLSREWDVGTVVQQYTVPDSRFRLDFAWPEARIALEVDGWQHRAPRNAVHDAERDAWLRGRGWLVFRCDDQGGMDGFVEQVVTASRAIGALIEAKWRS